LSEKRLEGELFGYEQNSSTKKQKPGLFELAEGGTLFIDDISALSLNLQIKLLRALETMKLFRLSGRGEVNINVRVLAANNRNLEIAMKEGSFRSDLFYRIATVQIVVPPLRERSNDILFLASQFMDENNNMLDRHIHRIAPATQQLLLEYKWPGNVRELKNVIERAMILSDSDSDELLPAHLPRDITQLIN
jgi:transcriptional regulator with PAS, ATPase and Fis domain